MTETTENIELKAFEFMKELSGNVDETQSIKNFTATSEELNSLFNGVALRYLSGKSIFELKGKDTLDFLNRIATNSLKNLQKGQLQRTFFTTEKGRIIDLATVANFEDYNLLICNKENKDKIYSWISRYIIADDVTIKDIQNKYSLLELVGPQSNSFITLLTGSEISEMEANQLKVINTEGMMFFVLKLFDLNGEIKYWLISDQETGKKLIKYIVENKGPFNFNLIGEDAYNLYRIEKGYPAAPEELNDRYNPHELGLINLVDFNKGCYIGQEVIARLDTYQKVQRHLKGVEINSKINVDLPLLLSDKDSNEAGEITSLSYCVNDKKSFGLAFIRKAYIENKTELSVKLNDGQILNVLITKLPMK
ncbi:MAG: aminomethyl transferase family protein [Bacteroidetes bacterium]|nr:aminomethyl transferase family protein [Bacteroidota bacterium]